MRRHQTLLTCPHLALAMKPNWVPAPICLGLTSNLKSLASCGRALQSATDRHREEPGLRVLRMGRSLNNVPPLNNQHRTIVCCLPDSANLQAIVPRQAATDCWGQRARLAAAVPPALRLACRHVGRTAWAEICEVLTRRGAIWKQILRRRRALEKKTQDTERPRQDYWPCSEINKKKTEQSTASGEPP